MRFDIRGSFRLVIPLAQWHVDIHLALGESDSPCQVWSSMALFLVSAESAQPALAQAIKQIPGSHCWRKDKLFFVPFQGTAQALTLQLIATPEVDKSGILVIRVEADYYGFASTPNWDWLAAAFRGDVNG